MSSPKLNAARLKEILMDLLFTEAEVAEPGATDRAVKATGIMVNMGFHPDRIDKHRSEVLEMLRELPDEFMSHKGGGWSFLNLCVDRHGNQWADLHQTMEELMLVGLAMGYVQYVLEDREMWGAFPAGMPYFVVVDPDAPKPEVAVVTPTDETDRHPEKQNQG